MQKECFASDDTFYFVYVRVYVQCHCNEKMNILKQ